MADMRVERLAQLLEQGHESSSVDYKSQLDLSSKRGLVEFAKDIGAMQSEPDGGYIVVGAEEDGASAGVGEVFVGSTDEAAVRGKLRQWVPEPFELSIRQHEIAGAKFVLIHTARQDDGFCIFKSDGQYQVNGGNKAVFRKGDVLVRHGTASERWEQSDWLRILQLWRMGGWMSFEHESRVQREGKGDTEQGFAWTLQRVSQAVQLSRAFDFEARDWEGIAGRLYSTNYSSFVSFLEDVYGEVPVGDFERFRGGAWPDDVLKDELRQLPSDVHRLAIEAFYGLWLKPIPAPIVAQALQVSEEQLHRILTTARASLLERADDFLLRLGSTQEW